MKSIVLVLFCTTVFCSAQGTILFANTTSPDTRLYTNNFGVAGLALNPGGFNVALYVGPSGALDPSTFTLVAQTTHRPPPLIGLFNGGTVSIPGDPTVSFQVRAWDATAGHTWESALVGVDQYNNGGFMRYASPIGFVTPVVGGAPIFGNGPGQIGTPLVMTIPIPEPAAWALGAVALFARFLFKRPRG